MDDHDHKSDYCEPYDDEDFLLDLLNTPAVGGGSGGHEQGQQETSHQLLQVQSSPPFPAEIIIVNDGSCSWWEVPGSSSTCVDDHMILNHGSEGYEGKTKMEADGQGCLGFNKIAFRTQSDIEVMDDGFRWRKYGKKKVKDSPNPRNYYRCSAPGCSVKKRVEREREDPSFVITTYEGKHNHDSPTAGVCNNNAGVNSAVKLRFLHPDDHDHQPYS